MPEQTIIQKIAEAVGTYAPGIASVLTATGVGAPIGAAVAALGALAKTFGMPENSKPEDILTTIQNMPDNELKLKFIQAEHDYQLKQRDQDLAELKTQLADVQNARQRQLEHEKATGKTDMNIYILAWTVIFVFLLLTGGLLYFSYNGKPISDQTGVLFMLLGTLSTAFGGVVQYFFGSSMGSYQKTQLLAKAEPIR